MQIKSNLVPRALPFENGGAEIYNFSFKTIFWKTIYKNSVFLIFFSFICEKLKLLILINISSTGLLASLATANEGSLWMERLLVMLILTEECHRVQSLGHFSDGERYKAS